jgi:phage/plasmid-associated DNA primase
MTATKEYRAEQDHFHAFLAERCILAGGFSATAGELHDAYGRWIPASLNGERLIMRDFSERLLAAGLDRRPGRNVRFFGIRLMTEEELQARKAASETDDADGSEAA